MRNPQVHTMHFIPLREATPFLISFKRENANVRLTRVLDVTEVPGVE